MVFGGYLKLVVDARKLHILLCVFFLSPSSLFLFVYRSSFTINRALEAGVRAYAFMRVSAYESLTHS